jgi:hypothetical protein
MTLTSVPETRKIVWVYKPPDGEPKQCYQDSLSGAFGNGYVLYEAPGGAAPPPKNIVSPELTAADREAAAASASVGTDNSGAIVMPEDVPTAKRKPRL